MSTKKCQPIRSRVWPAIRNMYTNVLIIGKIIIINFLKGTRHGTPRPPTGCSASTSNLRPVIQNIMMKINFYEKYNSNKQYNHNAPCDGHYEGSFAIKGSVEFVISVRLKILF